MKRRERSRDPSLLFSFAYFFFFENIQNNQFFWKKWLVNEFRTAQRGIARDIKKKYFHFQNATKNGNNLFNGLGRKVCWISRGKGSRTWLINQWMNDEGVCRTAPATPGLLKIEGAISFYHGPDVSRAMFMWPPCWKVTDSFASHWTDENKHVPARPKAGHRRRRWARHLHEISWRRISCRFRLFWPFLWHENCQGRIPGGQTTSGAGRLDHSWTSVCGSRNRSKRWLDPRKMEESGWVLV